MKQRKPLNRKPKLVEVYRDTLAGVKYSDAQATRIQSGDSVQLVWERSNPVDPNAIKVMHKGTKIGYIKRVHTEILHAQRRVGVRLQARISHFNPANPSWEQVVVSVLAPSVFRANEHSDVGM